MPSQAFVSRTVAAVLLTCVAGLGSASPAYANGAAVPAEFPTLSNEPALAQRQALGCSVVGLGLTGLALASGMVATGGGAAAASGPAVGQLLAYFGAGCTMGAFLATAFPMGTSDSEGASTAKSPNAAQPADRTIKRLNLRFEAAELEP